MNMTDASHLRTVQETLLYVAVLAQNAPSHGQSNRHGHGAHKNHPSGQQGAAVQRHNSRWLPRDMTKSFNTCDSLRRGAT